MLKTRQRRPVPRSYRMAKCSKGECSRGPLHGHVSISVSGETPSARRFLLFPLSPTSPPVRRLKFISLSKMAATGLGSDAEWRHDAVGQEELGEWRSEFFFSCCFSFFEGTAVHFAGQPRRSKRVTVHWMEFGKSQGPQLSSEAQHEDLAKHLLSNNIQGALRNSVIEEHQQWEVSSPLCSLYKKYRAECRWLNAIFSHWSSLKNARSKFTSLLIMLSHKEKLEKG